LGWVVVVWPEKERNKMMACMKSEDYRADLLLEKMRPAVNDVLAEVEKLMPGTLPTCPSMSQKAIVAIRAIDRITMEPKPLTIVLQDIVRRVELNRLRGQLEDFMAVWNTVNIMENPDNHTWFHPKEEKGVVDGE
jgi:hypothetical protein